MQLSFPPTDLDERERLLQREVRAFLAEQLPPGSYDRGLGMSARHDREFSKKLAARGWIGMALPAKYGGQDRSAMDRFIVVEELLRWGAPVGYHWVADRQTGPLILRFGTEEQKARLLPLIAAGEMSFSIGMSEPDSGSDLASVSTRAVPANGGWRISGRKIWTSGAAVNDWMTLLARTSLEENRHAGLTQFLVELKTPGLSVHSIEFIDGSHDFCEVVLDDVFVPDSLVLGVVGNGWQQIGSELAFERGGPDRWLSSYGVVEEMLRDADAAAAPLSSALICAIGQLTAQWWGLRRLSLSVARMVDEGKSPGAEAALVKSLGTRFEQSVVALLADLADARLSESPSGALRRLWRTAVLTSPSWTIRGGTSEVLTGIIAKALR
jgi:alkylation response protein AidB-like acyl-CoA dehydrogenase